jgi:hypothetical protein
MVVLCVAVSFEIFAVALLAAKMDDLAVNDPFYPFLLHKIGAALRVLDKFGVGDRARTLVFRTGGRKKCLPDLLYQKIGDPRQYSEEKKTSHFTFPVFEFPAGAQTFDSASREPLGLFQSALDFDYEITVPAALAGYEEGRPHRWIGPAECL